MNAQEAAALCRFAKACCPQQKFDEFTPDAWCELLSDISLELAKDAVLAVARRQPFVSPSEIRAEVGRIRRERVVGLGAQQPPASIEAIEDDEAFDRAYRGWLAEIREKAAHGEALEIESRETIADPFNLADAVDAIRAEMRPPKRTPANPADVIAAHTTKETA
jgi:hypothetical protein